MARNLRHPKAVKKKRPAAKPAPSQTGFVLALRENFAREYGIPSKKELAIQVRAKKVASLGERDLLRLWTEIVSVHQKLRKRMYECSNQITELLDLSSRQGDRFPGLRPALVDFEMIRQRLFERLDGLESSAIKVRNILRERKPHGIFEIRIAHRELDALALRESVARFHRFASHYFSNERPKNVSELNALLKKSMSRLKAADFTVLRTRLKDVLASIRTLDQLSSKAELHLKEFKAAARTDRAEFELEHDVSVLQGALFRFQKRIEALTGESERLASKIHDVAHFRKKRKKRDADRERQ